MMKKLLFFILLLALLNSCSSSYPEIDNMSWLEGKWISKVNENDVTETWQRQNDSTWVGESKFLKEGEVLFKEEMTITKRNNIFSFTSTTDQENDDGTVQFKAIKVDPNQVIFENLTNEFPQQIVYEKNHKDSILAYIIGEFEGKKQRIDFRMLKVK